MYQLSLATLCVRFTHSLSLSQNVFLVVILTTVACLISFWSFISIEHVDLPSIEICTLVSSCVIFHSISSCLTLVVRLITISIVVVNYSSCIDMSSQVGVIHLSKLPFFLSSSQTTSRQAACPSQWLTSANVRKTNVEMTQQTRSTW